MCLMVFPNNIFRSFITYFTNRILMDYFIANLSFVSTVNNLMTMYNSLSVRRRQINLHSSCGHHNTALFKLLLSLLEYLRAINIH